MSHDPQHQRPPRGRGPLWLWFLGAAVAVGALIYWVAGLNPGSFGGSGDGAYLTHHLIWLIVLGAAVVVRIRARPGTALKQAAIWILIGAGLILAYSYRDDVIRLNDRIIAELAPHYGRVEADGRSVAFRRSSGGHFAVVADVDGVDIRFLVDTGASEVVLSPADAERLGFDVDRLNYSKTFITANGEVKAAPVTLGAVSVGPIVVYNVRASVNGAPMDGSLLGMTFLDRIGGYRVEGNSMTLSP
ncbi:MAG: TIGR02281 family clan AA aspartic protease [Alphaproteobacteria bacterium]|nr:TIGR02281 family clan AA aspartic protease [Alphaproteobacteria bacterium]